MLTELIALVLKVIFLLLFIVYLVRGFYLKYALRNVPSPPAKPFIGHIATFNDPKTILSQLLDIQNEYGGIVRLGAFHIFNVLLITDQKLVEFILNGTKILEKGREYIFFQRWLGTGLLTSSPDKWRKTRKIITPTFHFQILEQFIDVFHSASNILVNKLKPEVNKEVDIYPYVTLCALDVICESAMGVKINAQENSESEYVRSVQQLAKILRQRIFYPIINFVYRFTPAYRQEIAALKVLHGHTYSVIKQRRAALANKTTEDQRHNKKRRLAFLDLLLESNLDGRPMTDEEIREEVDTFMFEGHDTTSSATAFTLYCLGQNKEIQDKVIKELRQIFGNDKNRIATHDELQEMRYLEMVIKEAMRLYPPVPFISRRAMEDTKYFAKTAVSSANVATVVSSVGGLLPWRSTLGISVINLHRDANIYPDPDKFDPERFTLQNQQTRGPFAYIPFSAGPRNCIGQRFAMMELKSTLSKVLRHYEICEADGFEPMLVPDVILKSLNGVKVVLKDRVF